jgi:uncharacterized protein (UPF0335 family)
MTVGKNTLAGDQLRSFVERVEYVRAQKKALGDDERAIMAEAKASGLVPAGITHCVKVRAMKPHDRQEAEALRDLYLHSLGMDVEPPLFRAMNLMQVDIASRESVIEAFKRLVPESGDIIVRVGKQPVRLYRDKDGEAHVEDYNPDEPAKKARRSPGTTPAAKPAKEVPDVDADGAEQLGREAAKANRPVIDNPFPFGDARRARFDEGWRKQSGGDGMGPD